MCFFFFKQKTAYEMRISDWSSDVCSSDLLATIGERLTGITSQLTEIDDVGAERRLLDELMTLSSEIEDVAAATTYRFSAARAYYALVLRRVEELREQRVEGLQTLSRSEEHTSELQSLMRNPYAVFCLKKK